MLNRALKERLDPPKPATAASRSEFEIPPPPRPPPFFTAMMPPPVEPPAKLQTVPQERLRESEALRRKAAGYSDPEITRIADVLRGKRRS
jgi:hypothetical protein